MDFLQHNAVNGYSVRSHDVSVTVTPYTNGFKIAYTPISSFMLCPTSYSVIQDNTQEPFQVVESQDQLNSEYPSSYNGYVEEGTLISSSISSPWCQDSTIKTTLVILFSELGFDANRPYSIFLEEIVDTHVEDGSGEPITININPS